MSSPSIKNDAGRALSANLKTLRELRNLTQSELGNRAGMGAASVSHFETGQRAPSLESLVKLADALEVSVDTLLGRAPVEAGAMLDPIDWSSRLLDRPAGSQTRPARPRAAVTPCLLLRQQRQVDASAAKLFLSGRQNGAIAN